MKNSNLITTLLAMLALFAGCRKDKPWPLSALPPATQTGARTAGCLINGEPWVAQILVSLPWVCRISAIYDEEDYEKDYKNNLFITMDLLITSLVSGFTFNMNPIKNIGKYEREQLDELTIIYSTNDPINKTYELDTSGLFRFAITHLDTINNTISGSFEFDVINTSDPNDRLTIRQGRFDTWYKPE